MDRATSRAVVVVLTAVADVSTLEVIMGDAHTKFNTLTLRLQILGWLAARRRFLLVVTVGLALPAGVLAQEQEDTVVVNRQTIQQMMQRIEQLEARVHELEAERSAPQFAIAANSTSPSNSALQPAVSHVLAEGSAAPEATPLDPEKMDVSKTLLHIRGFADFGLVGTSGKGNSGAFSMGKLNLFITSNISDKLKFLSEVVFENQGPFSPQANNFTVDVERALLEYSYNDALNLTIGRYYTAIGYYNTAYHSSAWVQTAIGRPSLFAFEDEGGILPLHEVGVSASGQISSGGLGLHYVAEVGNGRGTRTPINSTAEQTIDISNHESQTVALFARPDRIPGLQIGFSAYRETLAPNYSEKIGETIWDVYAMLARGSFEWLTEGVLIRHSLYDRSLVYKTPGFYSQFSKRFGSFAPYCLYQYINAPASEPIFSDVGLRTGPSVGIRYDATESVAVKLQYDYTSLRKQQPINSLGLQVGFTF